MRSLSFLCVAALLLIGCEPRGDAPPPPPAATPSPELLALRAQVQALRDQVSALDAEAEAATRELVKAKVERDVLQRELSELRRRPACNP